MAIISVHHKFRRKFKVKNKLILLLKTVARRINPISAAALAAFILLSILVAYAATPLEGEKQLYSGIIRFHVLANSDSESDQNLKLKVRDRVTEYTTELLDTCISIDDAKDLISQNSNRICHLAKECIAAEGYDYDVSLELGFENYPKRTYGNYTFPAGNYYSVRLKIGEAKGKNWWCVLFPPMCNAGAVVENYDDASELKKIGFTDSEISLISEPCNSKVKIRFFLLDLINKFR